MDGYSFSDDPHGLERLISPHLAQELGISTSLLTQLPTAGSRRRENEDHLQRIAIWRDGERQLRHREPFGHKLDAGVLRLCNQDYSDMIVGYESHGLSLGTLEVRRVRYTSKYQ